MKTAPSHTDSLVGEFAEQLRDAMNSRGLSQAELADRMGVSRPAVSQMLNGESMTIRTLNRLANAIGIRVSLLISEQS